MFNILIPSNKEQYVLHIIEPTLYDQTGHGYSHVTSLISANTDNDFSITVWLDKRCKNLLSNFTCLTRPYFHRKIRQIQKYFLYKTLLKQKTTLLISTAEFVDLKLCYFLLKKYKHSKVFLHFHQFNLAKNKIDFLNNFDTTQPNLFFLAPTPSLINIFIKAGIKNAHIVPCYSYQLQNTYLDNNVLLFEKIIFAGAARADKGFAKTVNLIAYCKQHDKSLNFHLQTSVPNSGRYDEQTRQALKRLNTLQYPNLITQTSTLEQNQYIRFFKNSICLLLYDVEQYHNKFSGVALDAFNNGCPVITSSNTWMGDTVAKYNAGVVVDNYDPITVLAAIETIIQNYSSFAKNAFIAAEQLEKTHNPKYTLDVIKNCLVTRSTT